MRYSNSAAPIQHLLLKQLKLLFGYYSSVLILLFGIIFSLSILNAPLRASEEENLESRRVKETPKQKQSEELRSELRDDFDQGMEQKNNTDLIHLAPEVHLLIFKFLTVNDLCRVGRASHIFKNVSEDNALWFPLYQKARLVPFADTSDTIDPHVTSYKHLWISIKILQAGLIKGLDPDYNLLISSISQAFLNKVFLFKLKSTIFVLKGDQEKAQEYWNKFNLHCLTPQGYNSAVFFGEWGFKTIPEEERLSFLREREKAGDKDAQRWVDQALAQGQLGQSQYSVSERLAELDNRILAGDQYALLMVVSSIIQGRGLGQEGRTLEERFVDLERYSELGNTQAYHTVVESIYSGNLGQDIRPKEERFQDLKTRAAGGDTLAQSYVFYALSRGELGQGVRGEQDRFNELLTLDCDEARGFVLHALRQGIFGQGSRPVEERIKQIEELMLQRKPTGMIRYSSSLSEMIFEGRGIGQEEIPALERFAHLKRLAEAGIEEAEEKVIEAIYEGKLGQDERSETERFDDLNQRAHKGSKQAARKVVEALNLGTLGQKLRPADERYYDLQNYAQDSNTEAQDLLLEIVEREGFTNKVHLFPWFRDKKGLGEEGSKLSDSLLFSLKRELADQGNEKAKAWINQALYEGTYGQGSRSPSERFNELHDRALAGDKDAEERIIKALSSSDLKQAERPLQERFRDLNAWACHGNLSAQHILAKAISQGNFEQDLISEDVRLNNLRYCGEQGNSYAFDELVDILICGRLGTYALSPQERYNEIASLSQRGNKKAQQAVVKLLTSGVQGVCYDQQGSSFKNEFLEQDNQAENERFDHLKKYALAGNKDAREVIINAIQYGQLGQRRENCLPSLLFWAALGEQRSQQFISLHQSEDTQLQVYSQNLNRLYSLLASLISPKSNFSRGF